jgi:CcmD family protein
MRLLQALVCLVMLAIPAAVSAQQPPQPPPAQEEFVPLSEVPVGEQIPAFTLVASAYAFVWLALIGYVWSVNRRLQKVERELATLERKGA